MLMGQQKSDAVFKSLNDGKQTKKTRLQKRWLIAGVA
jgi:hypothetical protein